MLRDPSQLPLDLDPFGQHMDAECPCDFEQVGDDAGLVRILIQAPVSSMSSFSASGRSSWIRFSED